MGQQLLFDEPARIRWLCKPDVPEALAIDGCSLDLVPWSEQELVCRLREQTIVGKVAEDGRDEVVGFMIYELRRRSIRLLRFGVHPTERRRGFGRQLLEHLKGKIGATNDSARDRIETVIPERCVEAQLLLKALDFELLETCPGQFGPGNAGYVFRYKVG